MESFYNVNGFNLPAQLDYHSFYSDIPTQHNAAIPASPDNPAPAEATQVYSSTEEFFGLPLGEAHSPGRLPLSQQEVIPDYRQQVPQQAHHTVVTVPSTPSQIHAQQRPVLGEVHSAVNTAPAHPGASADRALVSEDNTGPGANTAQENSVSSSTPDSDKHNSAASESNTRQSVKTRAAPQRRGQRRGKGSKSGPANRRQGGASDNEIEQLGAEAKALASVKPCGLTDEEKYTVVEYVTHPDRWEYLKVRQQKYWQELSSRFSGRVSATQICNFWHGQAWAKYKAVRENLVKHTGGGDGDEDWFASDRDDLEPVLSDSDSDVSESRALQPRRRLKDTVSGDFSRKTLLQFMHSRLYQLINRVARNDESVVREREFNSAGDISDPEVTRAALRKRRKIERSESLSDDSRSTDALLQETFTLVKQRAQAQGELQQLQRQNLELARRREEREEQLLRERQLERAEQDRLARAHMQQKARELRIQERSQALELLRSSDSVLQDEGRRILHRLRQEEEAESSAVDG